MTTLAIFVPVLGRPHRVAPLVESIEVSLAPRDGDRHELSASTVFVCSPGDADEIAAVRAAGLEPLIADWEPGGGDYARKMNLAWRETDDEWVFLAADDLHFHPGWAQAALDVHAELHPCVVGTNDRGNARVMAGHHSTHTLVHRAYGECGAIDDPTVLLHEGYDHNFVDDEFVQTAVWRQTYASAADASVEHLHPNWGKGHQDATYAKGQARFQEDAQLFQRRRLLWERPR